MLLPSVGAATDALLSRLKNPIPMIRIISDKGFFVVVGCFISHPCANMDFCTMVTFRPNIG